jgi:hypothetical protein
MAPISGRVSHSHAFMSLNEIVDHLPNPSLITKPAKTEDMIFISSKGICGENDFRYRRAKKARTSGVNGRKSSG